MLLGLRLSAIHIISRHVITGLGLVGMGRLSLIHSREDIKKAFKILSTPSPSPYPILIHCTQGKDRTGLLILLILLCLYGPDPNPSPDNDAMWIEAIDYDYTLTNVGLLPVREEMVKEIIEHAGLPVRFADTEVGFVSELVEYVRGTWGGVEGYLGSLGLDGEGVVRGLRES